jgi:uncharacterized protein YwgA
MNRETLDFLIFLNNNGLVDMHCIRDDNDIGFYNRKKLQKLVFLAQSRFNFPSQYAYDIYKYGPYSSEFTKEYYEIDSDTFNRKTYSLPENFDENRYISLFIDKDVSWLEISTTTIKIFDESRDITINKLISTVGDLKSTIFSINYISEVVKDLLHEKLIVSIREELDAIRKKIPDLLNALAKENPALIQ